MRKRWLWLAVLAAICMTGAEFYWLKSQFGVEPGAAVYALSKDVNAGEAIEAAMLMKVRLEPGLDPSASYLDPPAVLGKKAAEDLRAGQLLTEALFEEAEKPARLQSTVVRLSPEQGHLGQYQPGERVDALCYRQGEASVIEDLIVAGCQVSGMSSEAGAYFVTLRGEATDLMQLFLAQQEGVVQIVKKTAVQAP